MNKKLIFVSFLAIALILGACFSSWKGDEGTFSVRIGGAGRAAVSEEDDTDIAEILEKLTHTITLSDGPGPKQTRENVKYDDIVHFSVTPGRWTITIMAFYDGEECAIGSRVVTIKPGPNGAIAIKMELLEPEEPEEPEEPGEIIPVTNGNDNGEGSLRWAMEKDSSYEVIKIVIDGSVDTITINSTLPPVPCGGGKKSVTIIAQEEVTIIRGDTASPGFTDSLFIIGETAQKGTLTLGGAGSAKIIIDGGKDSDITAKAALITITNGGLVMNNGVTLQNNKNSGDIGGGGVYVSNSGRFTMKGGTISGNNTRRSGGGVYVEGGIFNMEGGTIGGDVPEEDGNTTYGDDTCGGGVYVNGGSFTMSNGIISGNTPYSYGGGVYVNSGSFTMSNGTISGNTTGSSGGGVLVYGSSSEFTMSGGTISNNIITGSSVRGGGVYVNGGSFTMSDGTISDNEINAVTDYGSGFGGGVCVEGSGNFTMEGYAVVFRNHVISTAAPANGGGVYVNGGNFTMSGGTIGGNEAANGGGVYMAGGTFDMSTGTIGGSTPNTASNGGGVYVNGTTENPGAFTMMGNAKVSGNTASDCGGGVAVFNGSFTMKDTASVFSNISQSYGGGVYVRGNFIMSGGTISNNTAGQGGGVFVDTYEPSIIGSFIMNGNATISGNTTIGYSGGGVFVWGDGIFKKTNGTIYGYDAGDTENSNKVVDASDNVRDDCGHAVYVALDKRRENTAGPGDNLDSTKDGDAGGWKN